ncbi:MAG TPA: sigma 54-interacting transcriptional regulator [Planctomycetota bacterium]|nr:sigma 54-interacting transcriptional regulator [Planctomycetota bacterium]
MAKLIAIDGPGVGSEYDLLDGGPPVSLTAGRDPQAEVPLNDTAVSRRHFCLESSARGWRIVDLGSRNQTFLNGVAIKEAYLRDGDVVRAGDTELRFESPGDPLQPCGAASTILKELPARRSQESFQRRIAKLESALEDDPLAVSAATEDPTVRMRRLFEVYGEIAATQSPAELFQRFLSEIVPALGGERGAVVLEEAGGWVVRASHGAGGGPFQVPASVLEKTAGEGKAVLFENAPAAEPARARNRTDSRASFTAIAAPIVSRGRTAGVLYVDRNGRSPFTEADLELLAAAAGPAGGLLERTEAEENLRRENTNLFRSLTEGKRIIGSSRATQDILEFIRRAAPTPMTVLIEGETGTGKELVASAIHYSSPRRGRPFVAMNCAALPEHLIESELFGHERGAFTGAATRRKGRFELADTGTVFLDEVGELTLTCQAKLLRLIEERQFERVGGAESIKVDVRIIAATNKDLLDAVGKGTFRQDLYYRLSVLNVRLAPLRERPEDIPLLVEHFLAGSTVRRTLGKPAEKKLLAYTWPGNVRQLRNVIESALVLGDGPEVRPEDLVLPDPAARGRAQEGSVWQPISLEDLEKIHIQRVLDHTGGNKKRAAEILGIERCTLYAKLKSYES